ncbi:MAG: alpha/beta fold hydrolase [Pseudomonadota bacterium]
MLRVVVFIISFFYVFNASCEAIKGTSFSEYTIQDKTGRNITYYLSKSNTKGAPLLLMIQGSGCDRVFNKSPDSVYSTIFNLVNIANENKFSVLAVEKPFSGRRQNADGNAVEATCTQDFHRDFTAASWVAALNTAIQAATAKMNYTPAHILIFGHSEGAGIASKVAVENSHVTHVITSGGSGTSQMFDFIAFAYQNCFDRSTCIDQAYRELDNINQDPQSHTKFAWGHPYKRWSSFFRLDPAENLLKAKAKVYLMFGTSDAATPALSQEIIAAKLKSSGKDIIVRRVPNANHMLQHSSLSNLDDLTSEYNLAFDWFWNSLSHQ